jgi:hypothetical protein
VADKGIWILMLADKSERSVSEVVYGVVTENRRLLVLEGSDDFLFFCLKMIFVWLTGYE